MAKNSVQFQKGYSLPDFMAEYGTEGQCATALRRWRWPDGFVCPGCSDDRCFELHTRQLYQCRGCHRQTSLTAGTLFEHTKLSLRPVAHILIEIKADSCSRPNHNSVDTK